MTSQWRHRNKAHSWYSELNSLQNVYFGFFIFGKVTEWRCFVTYLSNDPRIMYNGSGITLSPVTSKLFEVVLLDICSDASQNDDLHFGFKENTGSANAIFTLKSTAEYLLTEAVLNVYQTLQFARHLTEYITINCKRNY